MADKMTPTQRSYCMSRIRANDTKPEMIVRRHLWSRGFRYRLHVKTLPGSPDIVMKRLRTVLFINGCFWHGHSCQKSFPRTNVEFWREKITRNRDRDFDNAIALRRAGWNVITVWECELRKAVREATLERLDSAIRSFIQAPPDKAENSPQYTYPSPEYYPMASEPMEPYES